MRNYPGVLIICALLICLGSGCAKHVHYHAYLLKADQQETPEPEGAQGSPAVPKPAEPQSSDVEEYYVSVPPNAIMLPGGSPFQIRIDEIHMGYLHRFMQSKLARHPRKARREGLAGKELWLLVESSAIDNSDVLGIRESRTLHATNVKIDQESFSLVPLSYPESIVVQHDGNSSCRVSMKVYEIDHFKVAQALARTAYDSREDLLTLATKIYKAAKGSGSDVLSWVMPKLEKQAQEPFFFERLLLGWGATLEFSGDIDVLVDKPTAEKDFPYKYALYDPAKFFDADFDFKVDRASQPERQFPAGVKLTPTTVDEYVDTFRENHRPVLLPNRQTFEEAYRTGIPDEAEVHLFKPYIKFLVESIEEVNKAKTLGAFTEYMRVLMTEAEKLATEELAEEKKKKAAEDASESPFLALGDIDTILNALSENDAVSLLEISFRLLRQFETSMP